MCSVCLVNKKESTLCRLFYLPTKKLMRYSFENRVDNVEPGTWCKCNGAITLPDEGNRYILLAWIRSQGGGDGVFTIEIAVDNRDTYQNDSQAASLNKNWGICSACWSRVITNGASVFVRHSAIEAHTIDVRLELIKIT